MLNWQGCDFAITTQQRLRVGDLQRRVVAPPSSAVMAAARVRWREPCAVNSR